MQFPPHRGIFAIFGKFRRLDGLLSTDFGVIVYKSCMSPPDMRPGSVYRIPFPGDLPGDLPGEWPRPCRGTPSGPLRGIATKTGSSEFPVRIAGVADPEAATQGPDARPWTVGHSRVGGLDRPGILARDSSGVLVPSVESDWGEQRLGEITTGGEMWLLDGTRARRAPEPDP